MKANAPEKIYIISDEEGVILSLDKATDLRGDRYDFVDEAVFPFEDGTFEYTRTDAFIEKACDAYCKICGHYHHTVPTFICRKNCDYFEDFRKYMEGERGE